MKLFNFLVIALLGSGSAWGIRPSKSSFELRLQQPVPFFIITQKGQKIAQQVTIVNPTKQKIQITGTEIGAPFYRDQSSPVLPLVVPVGKQVTLDVSFARPAEFNDTLPPEKAEKQPKAYDQLLKIIYQASPQRKRKNLSTKELLVPLHAEIKIPGKLVCQNPDEQWYDDAKNNALQFYVLCRNEGTESLEIVNIKTQGVDAKDSVVFLSASRFVAGGAEAKLPISFSPVDTAKKDRYSGVLQLQTREGALVNVELLIHRIQTWSSVKKPEIPVPHSRGAVLASFGVVAEASAGFLNAPTTWHRILKADPFFYPSYATSNQELFSTFVGGSFNLQTDRETFRWTLMQMQLSLGGGYLPWGAAPFVAGEFRADFVSRFAFGKSRSLGVTIAQIGLALGYRGQPTRYQDFVNEDVNVSSSPPVKFPLSITVGPEFFINLDKWSKSPGFQIFFRPAYLWATYKIGNSNQHGLQVSLGFRKFF